MFHSRTRSFSLLLPLAALSFSLALAACGNDSTDSSNDSSTVTNSIGEAPVTSDTTSADTAVAAGSVTLQLAETSLGAILVDSQGNTLYLFGNDSPNTPTCDTGCLGTWPALVSDGAMAVGEGLDLEDLGTVTAADGSKQVTFYGHPLYLFAGDAAAGDVGGQGIGGVWFVVDAEGNAVK